MARARERVCLQDGLKLDLNRLARAQGGALDKAGQDVESVRNAVMKAHPIGRLGLTEDIALAIVFLASDDAGFMTGSAMVVDGGFTAQ
jgi:NAD(P)-dependent dehydrogenase (short-subunit alcohol dehydrogenase family)